MTDYLNVVYDEKSHPGNSYPDKLIGYLFEKYDMSSGQKILEPGCGRGEFLDGFRKLGMECHGLDLSPHAGELLEDVEVKQADLEKGRLPYDDNFFDVVYNKSLMEHLWNPDNFLKEVYRILKPDGLVLCLVPDWISNYKIYFDDFTHRTPFTNIALNDILLMCDFANVNVIKFRQLPIVWKFPILNVLCSTIAPFVPIRTKTKFFRWSRELMLIGSAYKPIS